MTSSSSKSFRVGCLGALSDQHKASLLLDTVEALCGVGHEVVMVSDGDSEYQKRCFALSEKFPHNFRFLENLPQNRETLLSISDVALFPVSPSQQDIEEVVSQGVVPVLPPTSGFENFNPELESGNAFVFEKSDIWHLFHAVVRASENHKFSYDWQHLRKEVKKLGKAEEE